LGRHIIGCVCCLMCIGPILTIIGIVYLASATSDGRTALINQYNGAADYWTSTELAEFSGLAVTTVLAAGSTTLPAVTSGDNVNDATAKLTPYNRMRYEASVDYGATPPAAFNFQIGGANVVPAGYTLTCSYQYVHASQMSCSTQNGQSNQCYTACANQGGVWNNPTLECAFLVGASRVCVKVSKTGTSWAANTTFSSSDNGGCFPCAYAGNGGTALSTTYGFCTDYAVVQNVIYPNAVSCNRIIPTSVRNARDPWVLLAKGSSGSMSFGLTTGQKLAMGAAFLAIGGLLTLVVYGGLYSFIKCMVRRQGGSGYSQMNTGGYQSQPVGYAPAPGYGAQPAYGAPPQGYAAPPAYGAQPGYGAAPAPYGGA